MATISGVLLYTCIQKPTLKYKDNVNKEYKVTVCISEDEADSWEEMFPKQAAKGIKTADFEAEYKIDAPFPEQRKQYLVTLKRDAQYRDGNPLADDAKPKVYLKNPKTGKNVDITMTKLVANGSVGTVSYDVVDNDYGTFAKLRNVRVDELIEYKQRGAGDDELGEVEDVAEGEFNDSNVNKEVTDKPTKTEKTTNRPTRDVVKETKETKESNVKTESKSSKKSTGNTVLDIEDSDDSPF